MRPLPLIIVAAGALALWKLSRIHRFAELGSNTYANRGEFTFGFRYVGVISLPFCVHTPDWEHMLESHGWVGRCLLWCRFWVLAIRYGRAVKNQDAMLMDRLLHGWQPAVRHMDWFAKREEERLRQMSAVEHKADEMGFPWERSHLDAQVHVGALTGEPLRSASDEPYPVDTCAAFRNVSDRDLDAGNHTGRVSQ